MHDPPLIWRHASAADPADSAFIILLVLPEEGYNPGGDVT